MSKAKRKIKSMVINLISGKTRRIIKAEVADIQEQYTLGGGLDVVLIMQSGQQYIVDMTKQQIKDKINE